MKILAIDIGGTHVKLLVSDQTEPRKFESGSSLTPSQMVEKVKELTADWSYSAISIGYPGLVLHDRIAAEPSNLGRGWVGFDFGKAFGVPVRLINDAAMQALGSYEGGRMLFLGLGTGLGLAMIVEGRARADGTGPPALPKGPDLRGLCWCCRIEPPWRAEGGASMCGSWSNSSEWLWSLTPSSWAAETPRG